MNEAANNAFNLMKNHGLGETFVANKNIWLNIYPGEKHSFEAWVRRFWSIMMTLSYDRHYVEYSEED